MIKQIKLYTQIVAMCLLCSCQNEKEALKKDCHTALTLTIEKNIQYRVFVEESFFGYTTLKSNLILLPVNKDVIDAAINLKCANENIDSTKKAKLIDTNEGIFLNSGKTVFVIVVINAKMDADESVQLPNLAENISIKTENGGELKVLDYTPSLTVKLNPGFNAGYVYFKGNIPSQLNSYSVHFNNVQLSVGDKIDSTTCALAFDQTNINFLSLIQQGMKQEEIRKDYTFSAYSESGLTAADLSNLIKIVLNVISNFNVIVS